MTRKRDKAKRLECTSAASSGRELCFGGLVEAMGWDGSGEVLYSSSSHLLNHVVNFWVNNLRIPSFSDRFV